MMEEMSQGISRATHKLMKACKENDINLIIEAFDEGADPYFALSEPAKIIIKSNNIEAMKIFLERGFDPSKNEGFSFRIAAKNQNREIFALLCEKADPPYHALRLWK